MRATWLLTVAGAWLMLSGCALPPPGARSAQSDPISGLCYVCMKPINGHGSVQADVGHGFERSYRCIDCALRDTGQATGRIVVRTKSRVSGQSIRLFLHHPEPWTADPPDPVFLMLDEKDGRCTDYHQVFVDRPEFDRYLAEHPEIAAQNPEPLTLAQVATRVHSRHIP